MDLKKLFGFSGETEPTTAAGWREKGNVLVKKDELEDAVTCFDRALALDPDDRESLRGKAYASRRIGDFESAKACYDRILARAPDDMRAWLGKGYVHHLDGDPVKAHEYYDRVLAKDPRDTTATALKLALFSEQLPEAELAKVMEEIRAVNPGFFATYRREMIRDLVLSNLFGIHQEIPVLGRAYTDDTYVTRDMRELEEAWPRVEQASRMMVEDRTGVPDEGGKAPKYEEPRISPQSMFSVDPEVLKELRARQPADAQGWFLKGDTLCRHGDNAIDLGREVQEQMLREAEICFDRVLALQPGNDLAAQGWLGKGYAALRLARYTDALSSFEQALSRAPDDAACWRGKAQALSNLGRSEEAVQCFEKVRAIEESTDPHHVLWMTSRLAGYVQGQLSR